MRALRQHPTDVRIHLKMGRSLRIRFSSNSCRKILSRLRTLSTALNVCMIVIDDAGERSSINYGIR